MRTNKIVRILSVMLALAMLASLVAVFASCNNSKDDPASSESSSESQSQNSGDSTEANEYEALTHTKYNKALKIATLTGGELDFNPDESQKGETLTDALITRNNRIKSDYGVTFEVDEVGDYLALTERLNEQQSGKLDDYDLYVGQLHNFAGNALQNQCVDYNSLPGVNLEGEWWDPSCREALTIGGKNFMMTGDISTESMLVSACMVFNKNMMQDLKKSEPYSLVKGGKWTLDTLYDYIGTVTNESALDGRGQYGLTCWAFDVPYSLFYGCGETYVKFDEKTGEPTVSYDNEKVISIYDKIYKVIVTAKSFYLTIHKADPDKLDQEAYEVFADGRALFSDITLRKISKYIRNMNDDYGVVPMPKYDEAQKEYLTFVNGSAPLFYVSTTEKDLAFVGNMMEAMATYNYEYVTDDLYEVIAKSKNARDPQTPEMVDIILRSRIYDFAYYTSLAVSDVVNTNLAANKDSVAAQYKTARKTSENALKLMLRNWEKINSKK